MRILLAALLLSSSAVVAADFPQVKYQNSCFACHSTGAAGAPKTHDVAAWEPRMALGMPEMLARVKAGYNAMPPTGLCAQCTDEEYIAMIEFMASPAPAPSN